MSGTMCDQGVLARMKGRVVEMEVRAVGMYGLEAGAELEVKMLWLVGSNLDSSGAFLTKGLTTPVNSTYPGCGDTWF